MIRPAVALGLGLASVLIAIAPGVAADPELRVRRSDGRIELVALEPYVQSSVASEVYASWPSICSRRPVATTW